jgi:hypothetical protein
MTRDIGGPLFAKDLVRKPRGDSRGLILKSPLVSVDAESTVDNTSLVMFPVTSKYRRHLPRTSRRQKPWCRLTYRTLR